MTTTDALLIAGGFAAIDTPIAVFTMSTRDMAVLHPDRARLTPSDVDSWCPPRGMTRPLEVTPLCVPEPVSAMGEPRPLVRIFDWQQQAAIDPHLA